MNTLLFKHTLFRLMPLALGLAGVPAVSQAALQPGETFPDMKAFKLEGDQAPDLAGKVVLVDFWASWCAPCAKSFPTLEELHQRYGDRLFILAVSVDDKPDEMLRFLKHHPITFSVVRDAEHKLVSAAGPETMPSSFIVDAAGKVRFVHTGFYGEKTKQEYLAEIDSLLK